MDESKYSTPMPMIGCYIGGGSLVCLLLFVYDIVHAFRDKKPWIPCRIFTLNSFTLTVLAIATKIPVDLTTLMPSAHDQLAKLCGTIFLCISMGFFFPSVGDMEVSECVVNVASLFIMVVTVAVNICVQIATGLIHLFVVEHILVLCLMFQLLILLGVSNFESNTRLKVEIQRFKEEEKQRYEQKDVTQVSRIFHKFSYVHNPQLVKCNRTHYSTVGIFCSILLLILIEAVTRALRLEVLNSYQEVSDYKWSMWMVVGTQIFTILVVGVAIAIRCLVLASHSDPLNFQVWKKTHFMQYKSFTSFVTFFKVYSLPSCLSRLYLLQILQELQYLIFHVQFIMEIGWDWTDKVVVFFISKAKKKIEWITKQTRSEEINDQNDNADLGGSIDDEVLASWLSRKSEENVKIWINEHRMKHSSCLFQVLAKNPDSMHSQSIIENKDDPCLFLVFLISVANVVMPSESRFLVDALDEVFEIIYFVEGHGGRKDKEFDVELLAAKEIWMSRKISNHWFHDDFTKPLGKKVNMITSPSVLHKVLDEELHSEVLEIFDINEIVNPAIESMEELYKEMERLFVGVLSQLLNQLPNTLVKYIFESSYKDVEERTKLSLKFLCKLNLIEVGVPWSNLTESNFISLIMTNSASMKGDRDIAANVASNAIKEFDDQGNSSTTSQGEISHQV